MLIQKRDILLTKAEIKQSAKSGQAYAIIEFIDMGDNNVYSLFENNIEIVSKLGNVMAIKKVNLEISPSKGGCKIKITDVLEDLGNIKTH